MAVSERAGGVNIADDFAQVRELAAPDTNACIAAINGHSAALRDRLNRVTARGDSASVSIISVFELRYGIAKSAQVARNTARTELFLASVAILTFDHEDAVIAGTIRAALERLDTPIGPYHVLIGAQALRHNLLLVTANVREFSRVDGLRWEDWTAQPARLQHQNARLAVLGSETEPRAACFPAQRRDRR
ncbi:MAG: PIN domain-containing protein [Rhizobiales bacterium]|nr:PIN domain-containing protein [Hyphomicrobiales bacterium]